MLSLSSPVSTRGVFLPLRAAHCGELGMRINGSPNTVLSSSTHLLPNTLQTVLSVTLPRKNF